MRRNKHFINAFIMAILGLPTLSSLVFAKEPTPTVAMTSATTSAAPTRTQRFFFDQKTVTERNHTLRGLNPENKIEFNVRRDEIVSQANLSLDFTPSPSLIPLLSQLKVYLNEELMGVITLTADQLGKSNHIDMPLNTHFMSDFNRVKLQFIGHYNAICENPANSTIWIDISKSSHLDLTLQTLDIKNELSQFPEPFFDLFDTRPLTLPFVFYNQPSITQQRAAAILASWFGSQTLWRGQSFPALFNKLPERNAIVFLTNSQRPDFLKTYPAVSAPTIEMISHPENPYIKLLVVSGRNEEDLITAVKGIARGNALFRGQRVTIDKVETIAPRQPYDAPNWVRTDRVTTFAELQQFKEQLQAIGFNPNPINLNFNLPPDLYLSGSKGIKVDLNYRYTPAPVLGTSNLNINLNNYFVQSYQLLSEPDKKSTLVNFLSLQGLIGTSKRFTIPVLDLGTNNELSFEFAYVNSVGGGTTSGHCESFTLVNNHASIDGNSTIDFSNYRHYIAMPNLSAFANGGFPFSKLADLSETIVLVNTQPQAFEVTSLLNTIGNLGAQTGYPALAMTLTDDWSTVKGQDKDILIIGSVPPELDNNSAINLLMNKTITSINEPFRQDQLPDLPVQVRNAAVNNKTVVSSDRVMSAIIGVQSPYYSQRSIVALLADTPKGFELLNETLSQKNLLSKVFGTVAIIRDSGVNSVQVGDYYYVGYLPWYELIWFKLQEHPMNMALTAILLTLIISFLLWRGLKAISRRRLKGEIQD